MRKHILSKFSNSYNYKNKTSNYYDEVTQVSYEDNKLEKMVVTNGRTSKSTNIIENSDPDEFRIKDSTRLSFILESSDEDELCMSGWSTETRVVESSDPDEFVYLKNFMN